MSDKDGKYFVFWTDIDEDENAVGETIYGVEKLDSLGAAEEWINDRADKSVEFSIEAIVKGMSLKVVEPPRRYKVEE